MPFKKRKKEKEEILVAAIFDTVASGIFQGILKENNIPYICRQHGAGGYLKFIYGEILATDSIYVRPEDFETAKALYDAFIEVDPQTEIINNEET